MRRYGAFAWVGACTLLGVSGFAACSSSEEATPGDSQHHASGGGAGQSSGGAAGADASVTDGSAGKIIGGSGHGGSGNSGGSAGAGGSPADAAPFDGNWGDAWPSCEIAPDPPDGSPECPGDLNLPGCPCSTEGDTVACWTGERKYRGHGACKDGKATCQKQGEMTRVWGACNGEVLPDPNATSGAAACRCFTYGNWKIENLNICIWGLNPYGSEGAMSTIPDPDQPGHTKCDHSASPMAEPPVLPSSPWSKNWLTSDCAGVFQLCYELKAGDGHNPLPTDCSVVKVCIDANYSTPGKEQPMPDLPAWTSDDKECATKWFEGGGYGLMSVAGMSIACDPISGHIFSAVAYCPPKCAFDQNAGLPECKNCSGPISGDF